MTITALLSLGFIASLPLESDVLSAPQPSVKPGAVTAYIDGPQTIGYNASCTWDLIGGTASSWTEGGVLATWSATSTAFFGTSTNKTGFFTIYATVGGSTVQFTGYVDSSSSGCGA